MWVCVGVCVRACVRVWSKVPESEAWSLLQNVVASASPARTGRADASAVVVVEVLLYVHRSRRFIRDGSP